MFDNLLVIPDSLQELSDECMARHLLYSQVDALNKSGAAYCAAFAVSYNCDLPRLLRKGRINVCIFGSDTENLPDGAFYLQGEKVVDRVLGYKPAVGEELGTMEEMIAKLSEAHTDFPVIKAENEKIFPIREEEEVLFLAEAYDTAAAVLCGKAAHADIIKNEWLSLLSDGVISENVEKIKEEARAALGKDISGLFRFGSDNIELGCLKMCEDGSGDVVIRIRETQGKDELHSFIMSDIFDMGFRFDINAYETKTFRINPDSMVRETNLAEGIIPFNYFVW